jgi:hypothetical protein
MQELIEKMTGYKATDKDMKCRGHKFELGVWYEVEGELKECEHGFHFCEQPSGVWAYYSEPGTRVFKVEAEGVLRTPFMPGTDYKRVCHRIRLVEEERNTGYRNTGNGNTGNGNTGHRNTGDWNAGNGNPGDGNTGDWNPGDGNTGNGNTGYRNTGNGNTGNGNTGHRNTGNRNTGYGNTGYRNTGNRNTGYRNTGDGNTGYGNATDRSTGFFCIKPQTVKCFDVDTQLTYDRFTAKYPSYRALADALVTEEPIPFEPYKNLPGITVAKLKALHRKHMRLRKEAKDDA